MDKKFSIAGILNGGVDFSTTHFLDDSDGDMDQHVVNRDVAMAEVLDDQEDGHQIFSFDDVPKQEDGLEWSDISTDFLGPVLDDKEIQSFVDYIFNPNSNESLTDLTSYGALSDLMGPSTSQEGSVTASTDASGDMETSSSAPVSYSSSVEMKETKPTNEELLSGFDEQDTTRIEIIREDGTGIVVEAVRIEDAEDTEYETSIADHDVIIKQEDSTPATSEVSNVSVRTYNTRNKGGRPIVLPRLPTLNACQNSRIRKRGAINERAHQVSQMEKIYIEQYKGNLDVIYQLIDLELEDEPKPPRAPKRSRAEDERTKLLRKREQNRNQTKKYRNKMKRKEMNDLKKFECLVQVIPVAELLNIGVNISALLRGR